MDVISLLIQQLNSSVAVLLVILIALFIVIYKAGGLIQKYKDHKERLGKVENDINKIPLVEAKNAILAERIEKTERLCDEIVAIKTKVDLIYQNTQRNPTVVSNSPIIISKKGAEIAESLDAEKIFSKYSKVLIGEIEKEQPATAYDIQQLAMQIAKEKMETYFNADEIVAVKNQAFENGLLVEDIMAIFGVLLRDAYLELKDIPLSEVDRTKTLKI